MREESEEVKANILAIATDEFAKKGFNGARVDEIAERTITSKRMIYYYFTDKERLFSTVLEQAYAKIRAHEATLDLAGLSPQDAFVKLVGFTFDFHNDIDNQSFNRLVMIENIQNAEHLNVEQFHALNNSIIDKIDSIYSGGVVQGIFRDGLSAIDLHMSMSAMSFFNVSNRATFSKIFKYNMASPHALAKRRAQVIETMLRYVIA